MGGDVCGISAWRLTCCVYAQRGVSIHHGAVIRCLSGLSGGRGTRRKISGPRLRLLAFPRPRFGASTSRESRKALVWGKDPASSPGTNAKIRATVPTVAHAGCVSWVSHSSSLGLDFPIYEMGRTRMGAFKGGLAWDAWVAQWVEYPASWFWLRS